MRSYDYFGKDDPNNLVTLKAQMELYNRLGLPATYMPEYDCLVKQEYTDAIKHGMKPGDEIGLWFEITEELCADASVEWRSRRNRAWDFYVCPGFIMSYNTEEKHKLIDTAMQKMHDIFGVYPRSVGAWLLDSETMAYMNAHYDMKAYIICREQWGMDGYTPWGGPHFGGYYPTVNNMLTPANEPEYQLNVPVFRMYVSDPMYSYYEFGGSELNSIDYHVFTQEPAWRCGQDPEWVKWIFDTLFSKDSDAFAYFQLGQESGFGFEEPLRNALAMQCEYALANREKYGYEFATVSEMGEHFINRYKKTPSNFTPVLSDWAKLGNKCVHFNNSSYKAIVFDDGKTVRIRDIHLFSDSYTERFSEQPCRSEWAVYDNLPIVDGVRFTPGCDEKNIPYDNHWEGRKYGTPAGLYFGSGSITLTDPKAHTVTIDGGRKTIKFLDDSIVVESADGDFELEFEHASPLPYITGQSASCIEYEHRGFTYYLKLNSGHFEGSRLVSENGCIKMTFNI